MFVVQYLPLNVDNLIHARPEACFPPSAKCPVSEYSTVLRRISQNRSNSLTNVAEREDAGHCVIKELQEGVHQEEL